MATQKINCTDSKIETLKKLNSFADEIDKKLDKTGTAAKSTADGSGNNIVNTYRKISDSYTKTEVDNLLKNSSGTGDGKSITKTSDNKLQAVGVLDVNNISTALKSWTGTRAQYDAIATKNGSTLYYLNDIGEIYLGDSLISNKSSRNIGETILSLLPLNDVGLHLLDGTLLDGNGIYKAFVDYISKLDLTAKYFTTEANWQASVSTYGVCGKFVYNSANHTVRLPKVTGFVEGTLDANVLGDLVEAGLPNITGNVGRPSDWASGTPTGAFYAIDYQRAVDSQGVHTSFPLVALDASRSSSIYGNSNTVQPQAIKGYMYIVVATTTKTDIEVNIDNVVTDLNNKVDISNMVNAGSYISSCAMPSSKYVDLTLGANETIYTAPANGWFTIKSSGTAGSAGVRFINLSNGLCSGWTTGSNGTAHPHAFIPALKGQQVRLGYNDLGTLDWFRFVYSEGEV